MSELLSAAVPRDCQADALRHRGFVLITAPYSPPEIAALRAEGVAALTVDHGGATLRAEDGSIYGARNVADLWPNAATVWRRPALMEVLRAVLGPAYGLVRMLFFDKPPGQTWALPWHRDLTIAVRDNRLPSREFRKPTRKAGVPHIQAPRAVLEQMVTLRLHLDEVTHENGPLKIIPGSHRLDDDGSSGQLPSVTVLAQPGDVLAMRPLLLHSSNRSEPDTRRHRRILHLEFAANANLDDGFCWHTFIPGPS